jgi:hypothetical protein
MIDKERYLKGKGLSCPYCGSKSVEGGFIEVNAGMACQGMCCTECQKRWQDVYRLVDIIPGREE